MSLKSPLTLEIFRGGRRKVPGLSKIKSTVNLPISMKKTIAVFAVLLSMIQAQAVGLNKKFLRAIHMVEASGRIGAIIGDGGKALGPLQIHRGYFQDAAEYDKNLGNDYSKCADLAFSERVVTAYLHRFASKAVAANDFESLAKIHNGGPAGIKNRATVKYWAKIQKYI